MPSYRAWQEYKEKTDIYDETRIISIFPFDRGFLITLRQQMQDRKAKQTFSHYETTFFATLEQANEIAHTLLSHTQTRRAPPPLSPRPLPDYDPKKS